MSKDGRRRLRWWPAALVLLAAVLRLFWIWSADSPHRQGQVLASFSTVVLAGLLLLLWLLLFSRMRWKLRLLALAGGIVLVIGAGLSLRIRGVSGDLVPVLDWRWAPRPGEAEPPGGSRSSGQRPDRSVRSDHDYPQFLGPTRDGTVRGIRLARDWAAAPPRELWRGSIGAGWSGFAVAGDHAVTHEQRGDEEVVACYELATGLPIWSHADRARFEDPIGGPGPRATPAIHEGTVYALGATGLLNALDLATGERLWSKNILTDNGAAVPTYGVCASPLVVGELVVVSAGGASDRSLVAYDRRTGERRWAGGNDPAGYGSPVLAELAGVRQILLLNGRNVASHDADSGRVLWNRPWPDGTEKTTQPVVLPADRVFVSTGYGVGGTLFQVRGAQGGLEVDTLWESKGLKTKFADVVHRDGQLYGLDDGILACLDVDDGRRLWKGGRYGHGQLMLVDDLLVVMSEDGSVALVEAHPQGHRELGRFPALRGKTWNHPALAGSRLLVRNDLEAACYELPLAERASGG